MSAAEETYRKALEEIASSESGVWGTIAREALDKAPTEPLRLYGFGARGVATFPPGQAPNDIDTPIPLWRGEQPVQSVIDRRNAEHGIGSLHVITYEVAP